MTDGSGETARNIFIFRHGETDWNAEGRFQGHLDIPINPRGRMQARDLTAHLKGAGVEAILSSDLCRAYETARIAARGLGLPVFMHAGLREAHLGEAQGLLHDEIALRFGATLERWKSHSETDIDISYPGGETGKAIMERVFEAMERFVHQTPYRRLAISTHGGVIRRIMQRLLPETDSRVPIPNGVLYALSYDLGHRRWLISQGRALNYGSLMEQGTVELGVIEKMPSRRPPGDGTRS